MSGRKLVEHIALLGENGEVVQFAPGTEESDLPDWAKERITNDNVWDSAGEKPAQSRRKSSS